VAEAKANRPDLPPDLFDFIAAVLLLEVTGNIESEFMMRFQQFTGPAMAKGVEDTAFYVFNRLTSLNEVGGDPGCFGISVETFHRLTAETRQEWPATMLSTSTHDTKRSEDVRCRIHLLSEIPDEWAECVRSWSVHNERHRSGEMPDRNMEYLFYQSLIGAWPIELDRMLNYMEKASREAKTHTSWTDPNPGYDQALRNFVTRVYDDPECMRSIGHFTAKRIGPGRVNSLAQTLIKLTAPGVPDLYQGTEIWDLSLVDPDNRRPVDYELRRAMLRELAHMSPEDVMARSDEGFPKLLVTHRALSARKQRRDCFGPEAAYEPVLARGRKADHAVAFLRGNGALTIAPRLVIGLGGEWQDTVLTVPEGRWVNVFTGDTAEPGEFRIGDLLKRFPVGLFLRE
jgi:(1->4)-alpha-D-glucan 1-alpha-D-glucosylmutase